MISAKDLFLAKVYKEGGKYAQAIKELKSLLSYDPQNEEPHLLLGHIYHENIQYELALKEFQIALDINPENKEVFTLIGSIHNAMGNYAQAEEAYRRAITLKANNRADAHFALGKYYENRNRYEEAIKEYEETLKLGYKREISLKLIQLLRFLERRELVEKKAFEALTFLTEDDAFFKNVLLNELEIAQKQTVLSTKVRSLTITMTNRCNLSCLACEARRYTWQMPSRVIKETIELLPYLEYIMWQGGEVFLLDYFKDILGETKGYPNLKQLIVTNGMPLSRDLIENLILQPDIVLGISVDGTTKEVYEDIRIGAKFEKLTENIKLLNLMRKESNSNMRLHLNVTIMKSNYHQLLDFVEFARDFEFSSLLLRPVQGNLESKENIFVNRDEEALSYINEMRNEVQARAERYKIILDNRLPGLTDLSDKENENTLRFNNSKIYHRILCHAPWQRLYIGWGGNVFPDCMCIWPKDIGIGNVRHSSIKDIWNNEGMQLYRKKIIDNDYLNICNSECITGCVPERYLKFNR